MSFISNIYVQNFVSVYCLYKVEDVLHCKISTGLHLQNGHHNTAQIQHCSISSKFDMWVDNDVPN